MSKLTTLILAAGKGTRMNSDLPKVLHKLNNKALIVHVIEQARAIKSDRIIAVIGHRKDLVIKELANQNIEFAIQAEQLGTGHAVQMSEALLKEWEGNILILS
ncbi:MAG: NTP transferase domain-containing protein, partial [Candidatus Marinimicrobia bacterium]|nr:NTP transferase domain-containing protein [Candidatus Neomarinimicrobiota bacterium]